MTIMFLVYLGFIQSNITKSLALISGNTNKLQSKIYANINNEHISSHNNYSCKTQNYIDL